jgi:hypothetical protein
MAYWESQHTHSQMIQFVHSDSPTEREAEWIEDIDGETVSFHIADFQHIMHNIW